MRDDITLQRDSAIKLVNESKIDDSTKVLYRELLCRSAEGTNGLTPEEKLQNVSETCFVLAVLAVHNLVGTRPNSMHTTLIACRWQLVILGLGICGLLCFRPELAQILTTVLH